MDVPEIGVADNGKVLFANCHGDSCKWYVYALKQDQDDFDSEVAAHVQWHEDGMPE